VAASRKVREWFGYKYTLQSKEWWVTHLNLPTTACKGQFNITKSERMYNPTIEDSLRLIFNLIKIIPSPIRLHPAKSG
jgi:hypothetical protein